jgi:hypothetical protein
MRAARVQAIAETPAGTLSFYSTTHEVRERVLEVVADEFDDHVSLVDSQPTAWGKRVDDGPGWFLQRFPIES